MSMLGALRSTASALSGLVHKVPWSLNATRRRNVRERLADVQTVLQAVAQTAPGLHAITTTPAQPVKAVEKYFKQVRLTPYNKSGRKGIHKTPHYTKLPREHEQMIVSWARDSSKA